MASPTQGTWVLSKLWERRSLVCCSLWRTKSQIWLATNQQQQEPQSSPYYVMFYSHSQPLLFPCKFLFGVELKTWILIEPFEGFFTFTVPNSKRSRAEATLQNFALRSSFLLIWNPAMSMAHFTPVASRRQEAQHPLNYPAWFVHSLGELFMSSWIPRLNRF